MGRITFFLGIVAMICLGLCAPSTSEAGSVLYLTEYTSAGTVDVVVPDQDMVTVTRTKTRRVPHRTVAGVVRYQAAVKPAELAAVEPLEVAPTPIDELATTTTSQPANDSRTRTRYEVHRVYRNGTSSSRIRSLSE